MEKREKREEERGFGGSVGRSFPHLQCPRARLLILFRVGKDFPAIGGSTAVPACVLLCPFPTCISRCIYNSHPIIAFPFPPWPAPSPPTFPSFFRSDSSVCIGIQAPREKGGEAEARAMARLIGDGGGREKRERSRERSSCSFRP